jgi:hypothetical protein
MKYKTIIICATLVGTMQHAWSMDDAAIAERRNALQTQMQNMNDNELEQFVLHNQEAYDLIDRVSLAALTDRTKSLELRCRAGDGITAYWNATQACAQDGINIDTEPLFTEIAIKIRELKTLEANSSDDQLTLVQFMMGDTARDLNAARLEYNQDKENHA